SKFAAEQALREFMEHGGAATVARVGTVGPHSVTGRFQRNIAEHFLSRYVRSVVALGVACTWPDRHLRLCPVDVVARCLAAIAASEGASGRTFHVDSPHALSHPRLVETLRHY